MIASLTPFAPLVSVNQQFTGSLLGIARAAAGRNFDCMTHWWRCFGSMAQGPLGLGLLAPLDTLEVLKQSEQSRQAGIADLSAAVGKWLEDVSEIFPPQETQAQLAAATQAWSHLCVAPLTAVAGAKVVA